jgi:UDP-N-acetylglucosamine/UDP-N-acetylgalactosamine 4-epimerase
MLQPFSFLITGGGGFIGSHLVEYLLTNKAGKVRVLDNFTTGFPENLAPFHQNPAFELIHGDICDLERCRQVCRDMDFVLHQAALGSVPRSIHDPLATHRVNVDGFFNMLLAAKEAGVKRFVYAASSSTYGDSPKLPKTEPEIGNPLSPYAVTKYVNELYGNIFYRQYGLKTMGLRYFNVFGPRQSPQGAYAAVVPLFIDKILKNEPPVIFGDGETTRDFTFVGNAVQANIKAVFADERADGQIFNVAVGESTSLNRLFELLAQAAGSDLKPLYQPERSGDVRHSLADISKACQLLDYQPEIKIEEGLKRTLEWFKMQAVSYTTIPVT